MNCENCADLFVDVLYGEDVDLRAGFEFFKHLDSCPRCNTEYLELVSTREYLAEWKIEDSVEPPKIAGVAREKRASFWGMNWWAAGLKVAGIFLMIVGALALLKELGIVEDRRVLVSNDQLVELVHDMTVARQAEDWRIIGTALLELKAQVDTDRRMDMQGYYEELREVELRYVNALEENNRQMKSLLHE